MPLVASILLLALTRAEIVERFRAAPITQVDGIVQVHAACPADIRREYQFPVAEFFAGICRRLYAAESMRPRHFDDPGIVVLFGDEIADPTCTNVVLRTDVRADGSPFSRILLPSPRFADRDRAGVAAAQAFYRCVKREDLDEDEARRRLRAAYPELKVADEYAEVAAWRAGERGKDEDERYLRLARSILEPGVVRREDVLAFASRLYLYPSAYDAPFAGRYDCCSFREAVALAKSDPNVRISALRKINELFVFGGGRGQAMLEAATAYVDFLKALVVGEKPEEELGILLDEADDKLKGVLEQ